MGVPQNKDAKRFYFVAKQRLDDAEVLFRNNRFHGSMYLGGYSVECVLKALILTMVPERESPRLLAVFSGAKAHHLESLRELYFSQAGPPFPNEVLKSFRRAVTWKTDWRYLPGPGKRADAHEFLRAVQLVFEWADGRM